MSVLISVGILAGLALWGFGCYWASNTNIRKVAPRPKTGRNERSTCRAAALTLLFSAAMVHLAGAQMLEALPARATPLAASSATVVPMLVRYDGAAVQGSGKPNTGSAPVTFLVYKDEKGGDPLWTETQSVVFDQSGKYEVYLGSTSSSGLPADLFGNGEARWLEIQITGEPVLPRTLLTSVPYALHAADASTLGGLPASAFVRAGTTVVTSTAATESITGADSPATVTTTGGTAGLVPLFTGTSTIGNSIIHANSTGVGIGVAPSAAGVLDIGGAAFFGGALNLARIGSASASAGANSNPLLLNFQVYNSTAKSVYDPYFLFQAEATGNNTAAPAGTMNLLYYNGVGGIPKETGLYFNHDGTIHFAPTQTFPGASGTITGVTAGTDLIGGGTTGTVQLSVDTTKIPTLSGNNSYAGSNTFVTSLYEDIDVNIDNLNRNPGNISPGLRFGIASGEGMSSKRTAGGNQYGLDLYTGYSPRLSINAAGQVAIGTGATFNGPQLQVRSSSSIGVQGTSSSGTGVQGVSTSSYGVEGTSTSGPGVLGYTAGGTNNTGGVIGQAGGTSGFSGIAGVWGDASAHVGVFGSSNQFAGVQGLSTNAPGVQGTSVNSAGLSGTSTSNYGVQGTSTTAIGVHGVGGSSAGFDYSGNMIGVWGESSGNNVEGQGVGVLGTAQNDNAALFRNNSGYYSTLVAINDGTGPSDGADIFETLEASTPDGTCGFGGKGTLTCTGQLKSLATTGSGARTVETYSMQSPENWMEDFGSATLQNGRATVSIDAAFAETVSGSADYHVFLTPRGDSKGLYVTNTTASSFEVRESGGGTSTLGFDYRIVAKRRGFESQRMVDVTDAMRAVKVRNDLQSAHFKTAAKR